jgi:hypothetical protein
MFTLSRPMEITSREFLTIAPDDGKKKWVDPFRQEDQHPSFLPKTGGTPIFSVLFKTNPGVICFGFGRTSYQDDFANALSNQSRRHFQRAPVKEPNSNWGTLEALARTVDAKSKWTAGHSEECSTGS